MLPPALAPISITPPTRAIVSITTPARCGSRAQSDLKSHADHDHPPQSSLTGNTRHISITKFVPEPFSPSAIIVVKSGTLTLYDSADPSCTPHRYSAGQGFVEQPRHVHLARNEGREKAEVLVTYLGLEHGVNPDVPAPSPGNCPF